MTSSTWPICKPVKAPGPIEFQRRSGLQRSTPGRSCSAECRCRPARRYRRCSVPHRRPWCWHSSVMSAMPKLSRSAGVVSGKLVVGMRRVLASTADCGGERRSNLTGRDPGGGGNSSLCPAWQGMRGMFMACHGRQWVPRRRQNLPLCVHKDTSQEVTRCRATALLPTLALVTAFSGERPRTDAADGRAGPLDRGADRRLAEAGDGRRSVPL